MIHQKTISIKTNNRDTIEFTQQIKDMVSNANITTGLCQLFCHHTSCSLIICENYDPDVRHDLEMFMLQYVPDDAPYKHTIEGKDDMPAHIRTILTTSDLNLPITQGELALGTWQGIFLYEHRQGQHTRTVTITLIGE